MSISSLSAICLALPVGLTLNPIIIASEADANTVFRTSEYSMCQLAQKPRRPAEVLSLGIFYAKSFNGRVSHHEHGALHGFHPAYTMDRLSRASLFGLDL